MKRKLGSLEGEAKRVSRAWRHGLLHSATLRHRICLQAQSHGTCVQAASRWTSMLLPVCLPNKGIVMASCCTLQAIGEVEEKVNKMRKSGSKLPNLLSMLQQQMQE